MENKVDNSNKIEMKFGHYLNEIKTEFRENLDRI